MDTCYKKKQDHEKGISWLMVQGSAVQESGGHSSTAVH